MDDDSSVSLSAHASHLQELRDEEEISRIKRKVQELKKRTQRNIQDKLIGNNPENLVSNVGRGVVDVVGTVDPRSWVHHKRKLVKLIKRDFMLHPRGKFRVTWDTTLALLVMYNTVALPLDLAFGLDVFEVELAIDLLFLVDIVFNMRTGYYDSENDLVLEPKKVAKKYICSHWFLLDILASIPWSIIFLLIDSTDSIGSLAALKVLKTLRLFRLGRLVRVLSSLSISASFNVMRMVLIFIVCAHWFACMFHLLETTEDAERSWKTEQGVMLDARNESAGNQYVLSLYWSVVTITTVGYGDISPVTINEKLYTLFVICIGTLLYMSVFGAMAAVVANLIEDNPIYREKMSALGAFIKGHHLSHNAQERVLGYFNFHWDQRKSFNSRKSILDEFPEALRVEVATEINYKMLRKTKLFSVVRPNPESTELIDVLSAALSSPLVSSSRIYLEGEYLYYEGDVITNVFFVLKGAVEIKSQHLVTQATDGALLGNIGLFPDADGDVDEDDEAFDMFDLPPRHQARALAVRMSDVFSLHRASFITALAEFDQSRDLIHAVSSGLTSLFRGREPNQEVGADGDNRAFLNDLPVVGRYVGPRGKSEHIYDHEAVIEDLVTEAHGSDNMHPTRNNPALSIKGKSETNSNPASDDEENQNGRTLSVSVHPISREGSEEDVLPPTAPVLGREIVRSGSNITGLAPPRPSPHMRLGGSSNRSIARGQYRNRRHQTERGYSSPGEDSGVDMLSLERQLNNIANRLERIERVQNASRFRNQRSSTSGY